VDIDWEIYSGPRLGKVTSLPAYSFDKYRFPTLVNPYSMIRASLSGGHEFPGVNEVQEYNQLLAGGTPDVDAYCSDAHTGTEKILVTLWQNMFGIEKISTQDNFFELGGDSLKAMTLAKRIHQQLSVQLKIDKFFLNPTIELLAGEIDKILTLRSVSLDQSNGRNLRKIVI
jgi:acyl carrier protein